MVSKDIFINKPFGAHGGAHLPNHPPDSTCSTLWVYLDISPIKHSEPTHDEVPIERYLNYRSISSRLEARGYELQGKLRLNLSEIRRRLRFIEKRLSRADISEDERKALEKEKAQLLKVSRKLLNQLNKRYPIYGDRYMVDVNEGYSELAKALNIDPEDVSISVWLNAGVVDLEFDDSSKASLKLAWVSKVKASRYHPVKGISKGARAGKRIVEDLLIMSELLENQLYSYRKGNYETVHALIPVRPIVLTAPKELSFYIWECLRAGDSKAFKKFKKVSAKVVKSFLQFKAEREHVKGDLEFGFVLNIHPAGDSNPFEPHFHTHVVLVLIAYDKTQNKWYRLNPIFDEKDLEKLRELWKVELIKAFGDSLSEDTKSKEFNVYVGERYFSLPVDYVSLLFELKYNARKMFVNLANYYERNDFNPVVLKESEDFVRFLFTYENRTERFGFLKDIKRYLTPLGEGIVNKRLSEINELLSYFEFEVNLSELEGMSDDLRSKLELKLKSLKEEKEALESYGFDYLFEEAERKAKELLSYERVTEERIIHILESLFGKTVIGYKFVVAEEDIPLWKFLDDCPDTHSLMLISDRHKSVEFLLFNDLNFEPDVFDIRVIMAS